MKVKVDSRMWLGAKVVIAADKESALVWVQADFAQEICEKARKKWGKTITGWCETQDWINKKREFASERF